MPALMTWWTMDVRSIAPDAPGDDIVKHVGADLLARWSESARRYHTTTHLVEMFGALEELEEAQEIDDRQCSVARLAAWFHDAVYDPVSRPGSNEADSAELARDALQRMKFGVADIEAIDRLVRLTARHDADAAHPLEAAFHDADLWILSAAQERFDGYCEQVRHEYAHVPQVQYRSARAAILRPLLHRDRIYRTSHALHCWETPARINLGRELTRLRIEP
jgi:predicted metal-dependent HD superfamily phosphohydrolase